MNNWVLSVVTVVDVIVVAEKFGIRLLNWLIYAAPPSYGPTCGLLPAKISIVAALPAVCLYHRPPFWKYIFSLLFGTLG